MKAIFSIFILLFLISSCDTSKSKFREVITSDTLYRYDDNNILRIKAPITNGMKNGTVDSFDSLGDIHSISNYVNDTLNGFYKEFYSSGIVKSDAYYINGLKYGERLEFFDNYQDSTAMLIEGKWFIVPYSTKLKAYQYLDLEEKVVYERTYDIQGDLTNQRGRIFLLTFNDTIRSSKGKIFEQGWLTPAPYGLKQTDIEQFYVIYGSGISDTIYNDPDSLVTRWNSILVNEGTYQYHAIAFLLENGNIETDTSKFTVIIK